MFVFSMSERRACRVPWHSPCLQALRLVVLCLLCGPLPLLAQPTSQRSAAPSDPALATEVATTARSAGAPLAGPPAAYLVAVPSSGGGAASGGSFNALVTLGQPLVGASSGGTFASRVGFPFEGGLFTGTTVPAPVLDLRGATLASNGAADRDLISTWTDISGNGLDATALKPKRRPLLRDPVVPLGNEPALFFNTKKFLLLPNSSLLQDGGPYSAKTTALVFRTADVDDRQVLFEQGSGERGQVAYVRDDTLWVGAWNQKGLIWGPAWLSAPVSSRTPYVLTFTLDAASGTFAAWLDGVALGSVSGVDRLQRSQGDASALGGVSGTTRYEDLGASNVSSRMKGFIADVRQWNVVLSEAERTTLEGQLFATYGVAGPPAAALAEAESATREAAVSDVAPVAASEALPTEFALGSAYPNPFTGTTSIPLALPTEAEVTIRVYDTLGRLVASLSPGTMRPGRHVLPWRADAVSSGLYIVHATVQAEGSPHTFTR
ncbi:MAG: T9SS type A sorting domain-containing protein, partial [Bacteroidota bacterium]